MGGFDERIGRSVGRRRMGGDPIADAAILLETIARLHGPRLMPRGLRRFKTFEEADAWAIQASASIRALRA